MSKKISPVKKPSFKAKFAPGQRVIFQGRHAEVVSAGPSHVELQTGGTERQKVPLSAIASLLLALCFVGLLVGCKTGGGLYQATPVVTPALQIAQVTNAVPAVVQSNGVPVATNWTLEVRTQTNAVWATNVVYTTAPGVTAALESAKSFAPLVPAPFGNVATGVLALAGAALAWVAKVKSKQASEAVAQAGEVATQLNAVIRGVESAKIGDAAAKVVKETIQNQAALAGVQPELHDRVKDVT